MATILTRTDDGVPGRAAALQQEFAALAHRTPDVLCFLLRYPEDPKEPVRTEPPFGLPLLALGRSYSAYLRRVPFNAKNLKGYEQGELLKGQGRELFEPPKPIGLLPLSSGCLYGYGDAEGHRHFASIAEEAGALTGRPLSPWTWFEFLFDWALRTRCIRWVTIGEHVFTTALNLPRASVQAIATLSARANEGNAGARGGKRARRAMPGAAVGLPVGKETLAKAILFEKPDISPSDLAKQVGVSRGTLYSKSKKWIDVRRTLVARDHAQAVKGTKSADGALDAEAEEREFHPTHNE